MFLHNLKYNFKILTHNKPLLFWNFIFIIAMSIFFRLTFSNVYNTETFSTLNVAVIKNDEYQKDQYFSHVISKLEKTNLGSSTIDSEKDTTNSQKLLQISYVNTVKEADALLENKQVIGTIEIKNLQPILKFKSTGIRETILKKIIEELLDKRTLYNNLLSEIRPQITQQIKQSIKNPNKVDFKQIESQITQQIDQSINSKIKELNQNILSFNSIFSKKLDYTIIEYFTLIAMSCFSSAYFSIFLISSILANMSEHGKRISVSPARKRTLVLSSMLSAFITHLILLCLIFSFNIFMLKVDYGQNLPEIIFISILGSIAGISFGLLIGSLIKTSYEIKINLTTFFQLFCCFLSGMMGPSIKYLVDTNFPLINHLNPANMIVDGLYSLQIYDNLNRYNFNIISLILFSAFCLIISVIVIRKQKYTQL